MDAASILASLRDRGFRLRLSDDAQRLLIAPPRLRGQVRMLTEEDRTILKGSRELLMDLLWAEKAGPGVGEPSGDDWTVSLVEVAFLEAWGVAIGIRKAVLEGIAAHNAAAHARWLKKNHAKAGQ
jgi:hypothetical protein